MNAFSFDCACENNWLCLPVYLTFKIIKHLKVCKAQGTLIVIVIYTLYSSSVEVSSFLDASFRRRCSLESFCTQVGYFATHTKFFHSSKAKNSIFGNGILKFVMVALKGLIFPFFQGGV